MSLDHPKLVRLLRQAYSAERAAALAYIGHARSLRSPEQRTAIQEIEEDEWHHRRTVLDIMQRHDISISKYFEVKYYVIGRVISFSCHIIGWFMPYFFAGRLESNNVCEYFRMMRFFDELGISEHHEVLQEMGVKEREHEEYFREQLTHHRLLPLFERAFRWGKGRSRNDVDLNDIAPPPASTAYCRHREERNT